MSPEDIDLGPVEFVEKQRRAYLDLGLTSGHEDDIEDALRGVNGGVQLIAILRALDLLETPGVSYKPTLALQEMCNQLESARSAINEYQRAKDRVEGERADFESEAERLCALVEAAIGVADPDEALELHDLRMCVVDVRELSGLRDNDYAARRR